MPYAVALGDKSKTAPAGKPDPKVAAKRKAAILAKRAAKK